MAVNLNSGSDVYNEVRLHPMGDTFYVSQSRTVMATARNGFILGDPKHGLFVHQTRLLSRYRYLIHDQPPHAIALSNVRRHSWLGYYIAPPLAGRNGIDGPPAEGAPDAAQHSIELKVSRFAGDGLHEDLDLTNYNQERVAFDFKIDIAADFADQEETTGPRREKCEINTYWNPTSSPLPELIFDYRARHEYHNQSEIGTNEIHRAVTLRIQQAQTPPEYNKGQLIFHVELSPHAVWHACLEFIPMIDGKILRPLYQCRQFFGPTTDRDKKRQKFVSHATHFSVCGSNDLAHVVQKAANQAREDLFSLRLYDLDQGETAWTLAAGLPIYIALFGRDTLTAAWQSALLSPEMMRGTLAELVQWQGTEINDWRDEQPGRMLHEAHTGPLAVLNFNPRRRYYGSITTSGFYPVAVAELWHWTGDKEQIEPLIEPALKALRWRDEYSDLDGDGFYEYKSRSAKGVKNQAWKDSGDAIVYEDGSQVEPPIATCEEQAFIYGAKLMFAEVLWWLDRKEEAKTLFREAGELKQRFHDAFWMEDEGFIALGLDAQKRQIRSISSNPGHCLASGIIQNEAVPRIADRLMAEDLFSGWGVRTLSSQHPAYDPYSYHRGSVWPVEQATFALGFMRYGLWNYVDSIARAQFEAAAIFDFCRPPEVFSGHARDSDHPFPALYPRANWPQAWSSSAVFLLIQSLLSIYPYAPLNMLFVDPHLPEWLPEITVANLHVGAAITSIRFFRNADGTSSYKVEDVQGKLHIVRQPSPWSLTATLGERFKDALIALLPGK